MWPTRPVSPGIRVQILPRRFEILQFFLQVRALRWMCVNRKASHLVTAFDVFSLQVARLPPLLGISEIGHARSVNMGRRFDDSHQEPTQQQCSRAILMKTQQKEVKPKYSRFQVDRVSG